MSRFLPLVMLAMLGTGCCRHHCLNKCDDRRLGDRLHDRIEERQEGRRRDPGLDPAIPPGVIGPRETIPATPLPVTPSGSNYVEWDPNAALPAPKRVAQKPSLDLPPETIPSDPVFTAPAGQPNRTLLLPDPALSDPLLRPSTPKQEPSSGILGEPIIPSVVEEAPKPMVEAKSDLPASPAGIDSFAPVPGQEKVASGRKPTLEGLDALKSQGYKTVLYLHAPDADLTAAKETVEKRGLTFVALAVTPEKLAEASKAFAEQLKDATAKPLFVYDLDGIRAGSLWYVQFRTVEMLGDEVARIRAGTLGLQDPEKSEEQKRYWISIQNLLSKR